VVFKKSANVFLKIARHHTPVKHLIEFWESDAEDEL